MSRRDTDQLIELGLAALGGVVGVLANAWLEKMGIKLTTAAIGTTVVSTALAAMLGGRAALVAGGAAAGSAGQLALVWMEKMASDNAAKAVGSGAEG